MIIESVIDIFVHFNIVFYSVMLLKKMIKMLTLHVYILLMGLRDFNAGIVGDTPKDKGTLY